MKKTLMESVEEIIDENNQLRELYKDYKGISEKQLEEELEGFEFEDDDEYPEDDEDECICEHCKNYKE